MEKTQKQESKQRKKVKFTVVRKFSGEKTVREDFGQLMERQTSEHCKEWRGRKAR